MRDQQRNPAPKIVISGANGYIARHLVKELEQEFQIVALSTTLSKQKPVNENISWRTCNPFSIVEVEKCLEEVDYAIYFEQSLHIINHLTQASVEDLNLIAADNFAQAAKKNSVKQLVYISCPIEANKEKISIELDEPETVMVSYGIPVTTVRINAKDGKPLALKEVILEMKRSIGNNHVYDQRLDLGSYEEESMADESSVQTNNMVCSVQRLPLPEGENAYWVAFYYMKWLSKSLNPIIKVKRDPDNNCYIHTFFLEKPLLSFIYSKDRSTTKHALFSISGGILAKRKQTKQGTLEFRKIPGKEECLVAIHDFTPSLPWTLYLISQAKIHLIVMKKFKQKLEKLG